MEMTLKEWDWTDWLQFSGKDTPQLQAPCQADICLQEMETTNLSIDEFLPWWGIVQNIPGSSVFKLHRANLDTSEHENEWD